MRRLWIHVLARITTVAICGNPTTALAAAPSWVLERPVQVGYAIGIGSAAVEDSNAHNRAFASALTDIASQLQVNVETTMSLKQTEDVDGLDQRFTQSARAASTVALEGVELVDSWCGQDRCWVWARLDLGRRAARQQQAETQRQQRLEELQSRLEDPTVPVAVALAAGAEAVQLAGSDSDVAALWRQRFHSLTVQTATDDHATVEIIVRDGDRPAAGLPVRLRTPGSLPHTSTWTDARGQAHIDLSQLQPPAMVDVCIDAAETNLPAPSQCVSVQLAVVRRRAHLRLTVHNAHDDSRELQTDLAALFGTHGIDVVDATMPATLAIDATLRVIPGADTGGVCFTFVDVAFRVTDGAQFETTTARVRGAATTCGEALRAALRSPATRLPEAAAHGRRVRVHVAPGRRV